MKAVTISFHEVIFFILVSTSFFGFLSYFMRPFEDFGRLFGGHFTLNTIDEKLVEF